MKLFHFFEYIHSRIQRGQLFELNDNEIIESILNDFDRDISFYEGLKEKGYPKDDKINQLKEWKELFIELLRKQNDEGMIFKP